MLTPSTCVFYQQEAVDNYGVPEPNIGCCVWTGACLSVVAPPTLYEQAFPKYFEDRPTPPDAFRVKEERSEIADEMDTNQFFFYL